MFVFVDSIILFVRNKNMKKLSILLLIIICFFASIALLGCNHSSLQIHINILEQENQELRDRLNQLEYELEMSRRPNFNFSHIRISSIVTPLPIGIEKIDCIYQIHDFLEQGRIHTNNTTLQAFLDVLQENYTEYFFRYNYLVIIGRTTWGGFLYYEIEKITSKGEIYIIGHGGGLAGGGSPWKGWLIELPRTFMPENITVLLNGYPPSGMGIHNQRLALP